jgi:hypothetical protein
LSCGRSIQLASWPIIIINLHSPLPSHFTSCTLLSESWELSSLRRRSFILLCEVLAPRPSLLDSVDVQIVNIPILSFLLQPLSSIILLLLVCQTIFVSLPTLSRGFLLIGNSTSLPCLFLTSIPLHGHLILSCCGSLPCLAA